VVASSLWPFALFIQVLLVWQALIEAMGPTIIHFLAFVEHKWGSLVRGCCFVGSSKCFF
jgi:hypothetical protein